MDIFMGGRDISMKGRNQHVVNGYLWEEIGMEEFVVFTTEW